MSMTIAISGKGGTGKTTIAGLLVKYLKSLNKKNILVIDADPNSNLHSVLGIKLEKTIGDIIEEIKEKVDKLQDLPGKMSKSEYISYELENILFEGKGFDFLSMGMPEGAGCYCFINSVLRTAIDILTKRYNFVIIDNEAGMEHFNRKTTQKVDILFIVSDATVRGIKTANHIKELIKNLKLKVKKEYLIVNRFLKSDNLLENEIKNTGLEILGYLPEDEIVTKFDLEGKPIIDIPEDSGIYKELKDGLVNKLTNHS
ncbi:MAG: AAA family ATPase [Candidatus Firestonebacteria bacterium]